MTEVMIDLETMSTKDNASVVSIGAVRFMPPTIATLGSIVDTFYINVSQLSCQDAGLHVEERTVIWWMQQSAEARKALEDDPRPLREALLRFKQWFNQGDSSVSYPIWANPAAFDLTILGHAYDVVNIDVPWTFNDERCYRTLRKFFPSLSYVPPVVAHNALEDAKAQTLHLMKMLKLMLPLRESTNVDGA